MRTRAIAGKPIVTARKPRSSRRSALGSQETRQRLAMMRKRTAAVDAVDAGRAGSGQVRREDGDKGQHARGRDREHARENGRKVRDVDAHGGNRTIGASAPQLTV